MALYLVQQATPIVPAGASPPTERVSEIRCRDAAFAVVFAQVFNSISFFVSLMKLSNFLSEMLVQDSKPFSLAQVPKGCSLYQD